MSRREPAIAAPGFLRRWQVWTAMMVLFLFPFFIRIPRSLNHHPVISPIGDQVHIFLFGGICLLLYWFGPLQGRLALAAAVSAVMGGAVEFLQLLVGRQALFQDFLLDLVGIGLVASFIIWKGEKRQEGKWVFLLLLVSIPASLYFLPWRISATYHCRNIFPVLANFENYGDRYLWGSNSEGKLTFPRIEDSPDGEGHVLRLAAEPGPHWPGATMRRFPEDWSGYSSLKLDVRLVDAPTDTVMFGLRLDDYRDTAVANHHHAHWRSPVVEQRPQPECRGDGPAHHLFFQATGIQNDRDRQPPTGIKNGGSFRGTAAVFQSPKTICRSSR